MKTHKLHAVKLYGSAMVELTAERVGVPLEVVYRKPKELRSDEFRKINPLAQVPVLELPDGRLLTESLAICTYLNSIGGGDLVPGPDSREYAPYLRWSVFLVGSIYSLVSFFDHPDWYVTDPGAREELQRHVMERVKDRFLLMESEAGAPWFLGGEKPSLVDIYLSVMTFWDPRQEWFEQLTPKIMECVKRFRALPEFERVFARNKI